MSANWAKGSTRRYPVDDLTTAIGLNPTDPTLTSQLTTAQVLHPQHLTRTGRNPIEIWPTWGQP